jgi:hypothetical protein
MKWRPIAIGILLCVGLLPGCASLKAAKQAQDAFDQAKAAGAETKAPYNYYAAEEYLKQMREEVAENDFIATRRFADQSRDHSEKALQKAGGGGK